MAVSESEVQRKTVRSVGTINFLNFFGIPIRLHFTFLLMLIFLVIVGVGEKQSGPQTALYVFAIFASVMLHELAHVTVAWLFGIRTLEIVMFPIGGISRLERLPKASQELWVALAGPLLNLAAGFALLASQHEFLPLEALREPTDANLLQRIAVGNLLIGVFNLLPAYPMDGGRILRAIVSF
ncbi:MAG: M50 family metallopeptidase, partial [Acidobacteriota bacterium]|nr:M50 family metallopeptidase [Acidobacteriota bacterium]